MELHCIVTYIVYRWICNAHTIIEHVFRVLELHGQACAAMNYSTDELNGEFLRICIILRLYTTTANISIARSGMVDAFAVGITTILTPG
jgi:hypothetical protein